MRRYIYSIGVALLTVTAGPAFADTEQRLLQENTQKAAIDRTIETRKQSLEITQIDRELIQFVVQMHAASLSQQKANLFSRTFTQKTQDFFKSNDQMLVFFSHRYFPVRHGKEFQFDSLNLKGKIPVQHGYIIDKQGKRWRVSYGLKDMGNSDWRIVSTEIVPAPGLPT